MNPDDPEARLQSASAHYPPPPSANDSSRDDFARNTAAAALLSDSPHIAALAQQQQQTLNHVATPPSNTRKRKPAAPGSRGVANLTPEQLSKKRANDREAQRAIRARTKSTIEVLEARIKELESEQPHQEMQRALAERDRALAECEELRQRLSAVAGIVGSQNLGQMGLNQLAALTAQQSPLPPLGDSTQTQQSKEDDTMIVQYATDQPQPHLHPDLRNAQTVAQASPAGG